MSKITIINKNGLRGLLSDEFLKQILESDVNEVTIVAEDFHKLEYSFGFDVIKYKPQLREFIATVKDNGKRIGVCTDFRHENILHAGDCGADFVEIDVSDYLDYKEHYKLGIEIALERGIDVVVAGNNIQNFLNDLNISIA